MAEGAARKRDAARRGGARRQASRHSNKMRSDSSRRRNIVCELGLSSARLECAKNRSVRAPFCGRHFSPRFRSPPPKLCEKTGSPLHSSPCFLLRGHLVNSKGWTQGWQIQGASTRRKRNSEDPIRFQSIGAQMFPYLAVECIRFTFHLERKYSLDDPEWKITPLPKRDFTPRNLESTQECLILSMGIDRSSHFSSEISLQEIQTALRRVSVP